MQNKILLLSDKPDPERDSLAQAWENAGGQLLRIGKFWIKPELGDKQPVLYGNDSFCQVLAQLLNIELQSPKDEWMAQLPAAFVKRKVELTDAQNLERIQFPKFIKPVQPKLFKAAIYTDASAILHQLLPSEMDSPLLCSDIVDVDKEVRSFILDKKVLDLAYYEGSGDLAAPLTFIEQFLSKTDLPLPASFVLDIGFNDQLGWFIIEFNAAWGAGLNCCVAERVLGAVGAATG